MLHYNGLFNDIISYHMNLILNIIVYTVTIIKQTVMFTMSGMKLTTPEPFLCFSVVKCLLDLLRAQGRARPMGLGPWALAHKVVNKNV